MKHLDPSDVVFVIIASVVVIVLELLIFSLM